MIVGITGDLWPSGTLIGGGGSSSSSVKKNNKKKMLLNHRVNV